MIILNILLVIIVVFILICMVKINLNFKFSEDKEFDCFIKVLFFKMQLLPYSGGEKKEKKKTNTKKEKNKEDKKDSEKAKKKDKKSLAEMVENIKFYVDPLPRSLKKLLNGIKIQNLRVIWCISTDDACETALQYARCCGLFYNSFRIVKSVCNVKVDKIRIFPDFINENAYCIVFFRLQISVGRILLCALGYLMTIIIKLLIKRKRSD